MRAVSRIILLISLIVLFLVRRVTVKCYRREALSVLSRLSTSCPLQLIVISISMHRKR